MSTRKIKDAKDLTTNELIYFKGHAKATYMSDGTTVEDAINNIESGSGSSIDPSNYYTKTEIDGKGYVTSTQLEAKQDTITDLADIREGADKGATSVQPDDISEFITIDDVAAVATSGSYEDLQNKPVYITDFDVLSLLNLAENPDEVGGSIQSNTTVLEEALAANKIVLVPYDMSDNSVYRGYATLVGYSEDLLYFKVITAEYEIYVETAEHADIIYGSEVTLNRWDNKQDTLVSGTNIKTINEKSILGSGNISINGNYIINSFTLQDIYNEDAVGNHSISTQEDQEIGTAISSGMAVYIKSGLDQYNPDLIASISSVKEDFYYLTFIDAYNNNLIQFEFTGESSEILFSIAPLNLSEISQLSTIVKKGSYGLQINNGLIEDEALVYALPSSSSSGDQDDVIATKNTIKTIEGQSLIGSGNMNIFQRVNYLPETGGDVIIPMNGETLITIVMAQNKRFVINVSNATNELSLLRNSREQKWSLIFGIPTTVTEVPTITFNTSGFAVLWANGVEPTFEVGKYYEVSFLNIGGALLGVCGTFSDAS